jgi:hypothetical protein
VDFYAALPATPFPAAKRKRAVDFGPSELGRNKYDLSKADSPVRQAWWRKWDGFEGRRVDLMVRSLPVQPDASYRTAIQALTGWLQAGSEQGPSQRQSNWYLAQRPVVLIFPKRHLGKVVWSPS